MVVSIGWVRGYFTSFYRGIIRLDTGHIQVLPDGYLEEERRLPLNIAIADYDSLRSALLQYDEVTQVAARISFGAQIGDGVGSTRLLARAIEPEREKSLTVIADHIESGSYYSDGQEGVLLSSSLAGRLGVGVGEEVDFELLHGERTSGSVQVVGVVTQSIGGGAFMDLDALNRLLREGPVISGVYLTRDKTLQPRILEQLNRSPLVAGITQRTVAVENFYDTMAETILTFTLINTLLASTIAFGVVYNSARIALSERGRELASLRVLGFNRGEVSYILLGELALLTLAAMPVGFATGRLICAYIAAQLESELYRIPLVLEPSTYAYAAGTVLASAVISGLILWRRIGRLDLVGVLKTRE